MDGQWLLLVNPLAGRGISASCLKRVTDRIDSHGITHRAVVTDSAEQLVDFASMASSKGYDGIMVHGGDGTLSHAAAGLIHGRSSIPVTVIPHGSGNDWARTVGIASLSDTVRAVMSGETVRMDAAECIIRDPSGSNVHSSILVNSAGIGLDAHVLGRAIRLRKRYGLGKLAYISSLLGSVAALPCWEGIVAVDGEEVFSGEYLSLTCGIGPYVGGGMLLSPSSSPVDDLLDATLVRPVSRRNLLISLPMVYSGSLLEHPAVSSWRGGEIILQSKGSLEVELDGEALSGLPAGSSMVIRSMPSAFLALRNPGANL
ncbi:MAG: hypothetical protein AVO35_00410 [Candidatus Aegiribacteria sp. MLS_C]|nr:MAG: hypothetical protein AVO35_00410 [Candidatus Aegiribacteria sp. MLS_C]